MFRLFLRVAGDLEVELFLRKDLLGSTRPHSVATAFVFCCLDPLRTRHLDGGGISTSPECKDLPQCTAFVLLDFKESSSSHSSVLPCNRFFPGVNEAVLFGNEVE